MAKLYFIALALGSALPALCQDTFCPNGKMIGADIYEYVLDPVNNERKTLLDGNKPNGESGQKLPPPQGMTKLYWNCDLEKEAIDTLAKKCYDHDDPPTTTGDKAKIFDSYFPNRISADSTAVKQLIDSSLQYIDYIELEGVNPGDSSVKYKGDATDSLLPYFTLMQPSATEIGCAYRECTETASKAINVYCVLNSKQLAEGDVIYNVGKAGVCSNCPTGTGCDPSSNLCIPLSSLPPTTPGAATTPSASTTTPTTTTTTTTHAPAQTTTPPTSPEANFPSGASGRCSHAVASRMSDVLRSEYERLHNFRRGLLATGQIPRKDGKYLPKASNMRKIAYDCGLEEGAILYASTCPSTHSEQSKRPADVGENFKTFPATRFTFDTAAKKSVTEWWKVIRDVNYFEKVAVFRPFHDGAPISSFTQMGWALSHKLGCSIVKCSASNRYVGVCRYSPRGNIVNNNIYEVGRPCGACPNGAPSCNRDEGLCS